MKQFTYTITDPVGLHARPASQLVKEIKKFDGITVTIGKGDKSINALSLMVLMTMGIRQGDTITVSVEGENEDTVAETLETYFGDKL